MATHAVRVLVGRQDRATPVVSRLTHDNRTPIYLFDFGVVTVGDLGGVPHASQPRRRHKHDTAGWVTFEAKDHLSVPPLFCRAKTDTIKPNCNRDFLHVISWAVSCGIRTTRFLPAT